MREQAAATVLVDDRETMADPLRELASGLAGEGETEDLVAAHVPVGDEPHHTS